MLSGGRLFKSRVGNPSKTSNKDEELEPTLSEDDASWTSGHDGQQDGVYEYSLRPAGRTVDAGWSFRADRAISSKGGGADLHGLSDDEDEDLYTSDREDEANASKPNEIPEAPPKAPRVSHSPKTPRSVKSSKKKKIKRVDADLPLGAQSPGKLKKKKKKSGLAADLNGEKKTRKSGKAKKKGPPADASAPEVLPSQEFQSFAEIDKLSESTNLKSPKGKSKKKTKKAKATKPEPIPVTKMSIRSNFFKDKLFMSLKNVSGNDSPRNHSKDASATPEKKQLPKTTSTEPKEIDAKQLKANAVSKIRAFTTVRRRISEQKQFLAAFHDEAENEKDEEKRQQTQQNFENLVNELQNYETMLEVERAETSKQNMIFQLKQESVEQMLNEEAEKNEALELRIQQLEEQLAKTCEVKQVESLKSKNKCLETEVELLKHKSDRQQATIETMMKTEKRAELKRKGSLNSYVVSPSVIRKKFVPLTENSSVTGAPVYEEEEDEGEQSGYMSISSMTGKAQGELLQLRSTLNQQNTIIEEQAKELAQVKHRLADLSDQKGVQNLKKHVENLENERKYFVSEIERLKMGGDSTELPPPPPPFIEGAMPSTPPATPRSQARWFKMTGRQSTPVVEESNDRKKPINSVNDDDDDDGAIGDAVDDFFRSKADLAFEY
ncbi:MAG: hypothetical protein SGBAC_005097 [Bacillariaceae sp.]